MRPFDLDRRLTSLASLGDPLRRDLHRFVAGRDDGVSRDACHLDKLVRAGLLDTRFERRSGRRGPGAGRTAKPYLRSASPVEVALPPRDYQLMAGLLARAVGADPSGAARCELLRAARDLGAGVAAGRDRVCSANLAFLEGVADSLPAPGGRRCSIPAPDAAVSRSSVRER